MIRLFNAYFPARTLVLGTSEACLIILSFVVATVVRLGTNDASLMLQYERGFLKILMLSAAFMVCMYYFDLYDSSIFSNQREVISRLIQVLGTMCIFLAIVYYFYPPLELGRGIVLIGLVFVVILLVLWRGLFFAISGRPRFAERTVIFGDAPSAAKLERELESRPDLGLSLIGRVLVAEGGSYQLDWERCNPVVSSVGPVTDMDLATAIGTQRVNRIIIALDDRRGRLPVEMLLSLKSRGVLVQDGIEYYEQITGKIPIESLRLGTLLFSTGFHLSRFLVIYKRLASIFVSIVGLHPHSAFTSFCGPCDQTDIARTSSLSPEACWKRRRRFFIATSFAPCGQTRRPIPVLLGLTMTIPESLPWDASSELQGSTKSHSSGMCS